MSEEGGESRSVGAFLLGFLTGVLVCIGIGGGFFVVVRKTAMQAERAAMEAAEVARHEAVEQRARADAERQKAEENLRKAKEAVKELDGNILPKPKEMVEDKEERQPDKEKSEQLDLGLSRQPEDDSDNAEAQESWVPLIKNVTSLAITYFDPNANTWLPQWAGGTRLPSLVKITVGRPDATGPWEAIIPLRRTPY